MNHTLKSRNTQGNTLVNAAAISPIARLILFLVTFAIALMLACSNASTASATVTTEEDVSGIQPEITRIAGDDAAGTAAEIANQMYTQGDESEWVVIARDDDFADAMSATGLAGALNAPIILADRNTGLGSDAKATIQAIGAKKAYIVGGTGAIPANIEEQLKQINVMPEQERIFGDTYWDTSVKCAAKIQEVDKANNETPASDVIVAMGINFQDALSISSLAYSYHMPIYLQTDGSTQPGVEGAAARVLTDDAISAIKATLGDSGKIYVPGGNGAVAKETVEDVFTGKEVIRMSGEDGFQTSNEIARYLTSEEGGYKLSANTVCIANGAEAPKGTDALAGSALAGKNGGVVLLANTNAVCGSVSTATLEGIYTNNEQSVPAFLTSAAQDIYTVDILGGAFVMPQVVIDIAKMNLWNWRKVSFDTNGGSSVDAQKVWKGGKAYQPDELPVKVGSGLDGWYKDKELTQVFNFNEEVINKSTTIYAKWLEAASTDANGKATPTDTNGTKYAFVLTDTAGNAIEGASVYINSEGKTIVELPRSASSKDVKATLCDASGHPLEGKVIDINNLGGMSRDNGTTDAEGVFKSYVTNKGVTAEDGKASPTNPKTDKAQPILLTDTADPANPIEGASVVVDKDGVTTITLPAQYDNEDVVVTVYDETGTTGAEGSQVVINRSNGKQRNSGTTAADGTFKAVAPAAVTDASGTTIVKGENGVNYQVTVTDTATPAEGIEDATIVVDKDGKATVTLPNGMQDTNVVVTFMSEDGTKAQSGIEVSVYNEGETTARTSGKTNSKGVHTSKVVTEGVTAEKTGNVTLKSPDGKVTYTINVTNATAQSVIAGAVVTLNNNGNVCVALPEGTQINDAIDVKVTTDTAGTKPQSGVSVTIIGDTESVAGETGKDGIFSTSLNINETDAQGKATVIGEDGKTYQFTITDDATPTANPIEGAIISVDAQGKATVTLPEEAKGKNVVAVVMDEAGTVAQAGMEVVLVESDDTTRGSGKTDANGNVTFSMLTDAMVQVTGDTSLVYTGEEQKPAVMVDGLTQGSDFTVAYQNNVNAGTGKIIIKGAGTCAGTVEKTFKIAQAEAQISWENKAFTYNGEAQAPKATVSNKVASDVVEVTVDGAKTDAGTNYTATATALTGDNANNYTLPTTKPTTEFKINALSIKDITTIILEDKNFEYDGNKKTQTVSKVEVTTTEGKKLTLDSPKDYELSGNVEINASDNHTLTVTGKGNFKDSATTAWKIAAATLSPTDAEKNGITATAATGDKLSAITLPTTYGGQAGKFEITKDENKKAVEADATISADGTYTYYAKFTPTSTNYAAVENVKVTVTATSTSGITSTTDGSVTLTNPKDSAKYKVTVYTSNSTAIGLALGGAAVSFSDAGVLTVASPNTTEDAKDFIVTVETTDTIPVAKGGVSVTVNKKDGTAIDSGTTLTAADTTAGLSTGQYRAHNGVTWTTTISSPCSCTQTTTKTGKCTNCNSNTVTQTTPAKGHVDDNGNSALKAYGSGDVAQECTQCGHVLFGTYKQTSDGTDSAPIEWVKLGSEGTATSGIVSDDLSVQTLISLQGLDAVQFGSSSGSYASSSIKTWLTNTFYSKAFSEKEQPVIASTKLTDVSVTDTKVFLLSSDEANDLFESREDRICVSTPFARTTQTNSATACYVYDKQACGWWLRTKSNVYNNRVALVGPTGGVDAIGTPVTDKAYAARPVINLKL